MGMVACVLPAVSFRFSPTAVNPHKKGRRAPPLTISTNHSNVDPVHLRDLLHASGHSCHRFPNLGADGRPEPVDLGKLRTALAHSSVVVSVFCRSSFPGDDHGGGGISCFAGWEGLFERPVPVPGRDSRLVGFGRAVTDGGLTASIHDVAVIPSLQRLGIGRKIMQRIIRVLTSRGIYDISALCSKEESACGFGDDSLGSTTMMYTRATSSSIKEKLIVKLAGRMLLLVP